VLKLNQYYALTKQYGKAIKMLGNYLLKNPNDFEIRYLLAMNLAYDRDFKNAFTQTNILVNEGPDSLKYKMLKAQLSVWMNEDLNNAEKILLDILKKEPNNLQALITLSTLKFQQKKYEDSRNYALLAEKIDPANNDLNRIKYMLDLQLKRDREADLFKLLEEARKLAFYEKCDEAIEKYKQYIFEAQSDGIELDKEIALEMANAYVCAKKYTNAISIYDSLLDKAYNFEIDKQRAKVYFWSGDSVNALIHLKNLYAKNPNIAETKLYLGDAYSQMHQYESAKKIYEEMLAESPSSYIIKERLSWLPTEEGFFSEGIPTYFLLSPEVNIFSDDQSFFYSLQGFKLEMGITKFLSIAGSVFRGSLNSDSVSSKQNLNIFKAFLYLRFAHVFLFSGAYGKTLFVNSGSREIFQASLKAEKENEYLVSASFNSMDAAHLLYSANLVNNRLKANNFVFEANYRKPNGILVSGNYSYYKISDGNNGNDFEFRLGKQFFSDLTLGYEYFYSNYRLVSPLYYSPNNFESHSLWAELNLIKNEKTKINIGSKVGLISNSNFILRQTYIEAEHKIINNLTVQGNITAGSTVRNDEGYSSISILAAVFWSF
ncbi:MAG: hypothetical protein ABI550_07550, partial [Ignavibacteriaceae bacterium]